MTSAITLDEQASDLRADLEAHPTVADAEVQTDRRPHQVRVGLPEASERVPEGVQDILEQHQATIADVEQGTAAWYLHVRPSAAWRPAGQRTIRAHGGSIVCTLTREALEASGLGEDDEVDLEAREGQVRISRRDA